MKKLKRSGFKSLSHISFRSAVLHDAIQRRTNVCKGTNFSSWMVGMMEVLKIFSPPSSSSSPSSSLFASSSSSPSSSSPFSSPAFFLCATQWRPQYGRSLLESHLCLLRLLWEPWSHAYVFYASFANCLWWNNKKCLREPARAVILYKINLFLLLAARMSVDEGSEINLFLLLTAQTSVDEGSGFNSVIKRAWARVVLG